MTNLIETAALRRLRNYYSYEEASKWLLSPHPQLEGATPIDLIEDGKAARVFEVIDRLDSDGYL